MLCEIKFIKIKIRMSFYFKKVKIMVLIGWFICFVLVVVYRQEQREEDMIGCLVMVLILW